ncbi:MAG: 2-oxoglutarate dehydrogenase complex dihydrolipoyllysine-residue succinyltransferase [Sphingobacteriales bacterium]|nr:2-oxoglutarate dehydrogenase complex dihydrolipoyllysine-residue succinyltransferase [Sphingobacteriales bacterium]
MPIIEIKVPSVGESITEVTLSRLVVPNGSVVAMDDLLCEFESDKANFELNAEAAGTVQFLANEGDDVKVGSIICTINTDAAAANNTAPPTAQKTIVETTTTTTPSTETKTTYATGHASPAAAKMLEEANIDPKNIKGTGPDGRITKEDVQIYIEQQQKTPAPQEKTTTPEAKITTPETKTTTPQAPTPQAGARSQRREKMSRLRKTIAKRLVEAKNQTAMLTTFNEVDLTEIMSLRKKYKEAFEKKHGIGLGFMSFFSKAAATALLEFPAVNASLADEDSIEYHDYADISVAVSTDKGLVVPVIRNVEGLTLQGIELAIKNVATKARDGKLSMEEMTGGTFTITNGGVFGSLLSTPIINPPQTAILGMHTIQERPMAVAGEVKIRPMMYLALSYDHRIIDGKEAVSFLVRIKQLLEDPIKLFLDI